MASERFRILHVDDDADDAELTRLMLLSAPFPVQITPAADGREALALLRFEAIRGRRPDLILLDLNMPVMDGREFLRLIKAEPAFSAIPVVIFTTSQLAEEIAACRALGASGYVRKPARLEGFDELRRIVAGLRDEARRRPR